MPVMGGRRSCAGRGRQTENRTSERATRFIGFPKDFDMDRDSSGSRSLLRSWMRTGEFGAAGLLLGCEFHEFDACVVWIVEVELPFTVAAQFWFFAEFHAIL